MSLRALIVDDEELARGALDDLLSQRDDVTIVAHAESLETAAEAIERCAPDVIFLDVTLGDGDAFELFDRVAVDAHVVFLTASEAHALRAFAVNALDYLLKPAQPHHLDRALGRARTAVPSPRRQLAALTPTDRVCLREARGMRFCRVADIVFVRAAGDYTEVHLCEPRMVLVHRRFRDWLSRLPSDFAQCHRSILVNLHFVETFDHMGPTARVCLQTVDDPLPVSRRLAPSFKQRLAAFARE